MSNPEYLHGHALIWLNTPGGESIDYNSTPFKIENIEESRDIFEISRVRASNDNIKFNLKSKEDANNIIILFSNYPKSWMIEELKIRKLGQDDTIPIRIKYIPVDKIERRVKIHIFTEDGSYHTVEELVLKRENKIEKIMNDIFDFFLKIL